MDSPKVEILCLANYSDFSKDGKLSINGIFDEIYTEKVPSSFLRGFLIFTVSGISSSKEEKIKVIIKDPSGKTTLDKDVGIVAGNQGKGNFIAELVGMPLPTEGKYLISLNHGGKEIGGTIFTVKGVNTNGRGSGNSKKIIN